jgi:uncharacterized membrane protein YfcA
MWRWAVPRTADQLGPADPIFWLVVLSSFLAAAISGAFAIGGGFLMMGVCAAFLPISAVVPLHSALMLGTSLGRSFFFWRYVHWGITVPFILGCLIGAPAGTRIYVTLPEALIALVVAVFMLAAVWFPPVDWKLRLRHPFFIVGVVHSFLSALFSFGGVMQPLMMRTRLDKMQVIATLAVSLLAMNVFKLGGYAAFGFDFGPYALLIAVSLLAGVAGSGVGRRIVERLPEERFRVIFKLIMTGLALQLLYRAWKTV